MSWPESASCSRVLALLVALLAITPQLTSQEHGHSAANQLPHQSTPQLTSQEQDHSAANQHPHQRTFQERKDSDSSADPYPHQNTLQLTSNEHDYSAASHHPHENTPPLRSQEHAADAFAIPGVLLAGNSTFSGITQALLRAADSRVSEKYWPPFEPNLRIILSSIISIVGAALANAGGVGGGGLFVPMFNLLLGYDTKTSAALSKSMIMGGAIASVCFNVQLKHPSKQCSLINYDVARLMQPMLLLGISVGVTFNVMFPPWIITAMLFVLLLIVTVKTLDKAEATRKKEHSALAAASHVLAQEVTPGAQQETPTPDRPLEAAELLTEPLLPPGIRASPASPEIPPRTLSGTTLGRTSSSSSGRRAQGSQGGPQAPAPRVLSSQALEAPYDYEGPGEAVESYDSEEEGGSLGPSRRTVGLAKSSSMMRRLLIGEPREVPLRELVPWAAVGELLLVWGVYLGIQIVKSNVELCGALYWGLQALQVPVSLVATGLAAWRLNVEHHKRLAVGGCQGGYSPVLDEEDTQWEFSKVCIYPLYALLAGTMGGMLGIGGGMVMGPVLLELGLRPQVTAATSTFVVVFSSSLSVVEFYLLGRIPIEVALYFCAIATVAAFAGLTIIRAYVIRSGKASVIIFILGGIIGISGILLGTLGVLKIYNDWLEGITDFGFRSPCSKVGE